MNSREIFPIMLYDDQCYLCTKFAKIINFVAGNKIIILGHYSSQGIQIRNQFLDNSALEMFWLINEKSANGGRAALLPLIFAIVNTKKRFTKKVEFKNTCEKNCKTVKSVFIRSFSILSKSKKIKLK